MPRDTVMVLGMWCGYELGSGAGHSNSCAMVDPKCCLAIAFGISGCGVLGEQDGVLTP